MSLNPSEEQIDIVTALDNFNIIVEAVPGAGKTTSITFLIEKYCESEVIGIFLYNRRATDETQEKLEKYFPFMPELPEVNTYHSFGGKYFDVKCHTDKGLMAIVNGNPNPKKEVCYTMIIIDEAQDMTPLYHMLMKKIINPGTKLVLLGDKRQAIYGFNNADHRFLTLADKLGLGQDRDFIRLPLSVSYRLSAPIADFVNHCIIKEDAIKPSPKKLEGYPKPIYLIDNFWDPVLGPRKIMNYIVDLMSKGYTADDIFILAPSVKIKLGNQYSRSPAQVLVEELINHQPPIRVFVPNSDDAAITNEDIKGKIVFCTYHKVKGLERKVIIVLGADASYFKYYAKDADPAVCPNPLYVALTRSAEHLMVCHNASNDYLPFLDSKLLNIYCTVIGQTSKPSKVKCDDINKILHPSDIVGHMPQEYITEIMSNFKTIQKRPIQSSVSLPTRQRDADGCEIVSEITSIYISELHSLLTNKDGCHNEIKSHDIFTHLCGIYNWDILENPHHPLFEEAAIWKMLQQTTKYCGENSGFMHKSKQITKYNWIKQGQVLQLLGRLKSTLSNNCLYEDSITLMNKKLITGTIVRTVHAPELVTERAVVTLCGRSDIVDLDKKIVWEIKCVQELKDEHFIQLLVYKYMYFKLGLYTDFKYLLHNIRTGQIYHIVCPDDKMIEIMKYLVEKKFERKQYNNDQEFIKNYL